MTTTHNIEAQQAIHQAATELAALEFIDQETAVLLTEEMGHTPKLVKGEEEALEEEPIIQFCHHF